MIELVKVQRGLITFCYPYCIGTRDRALVVQPIDVATQCGVRVTAS